MTLDRKNVIRRYDSSSNKVECGNCKRKTFQMLKLQKKTLDL